MKGLKNIRFFFAFLLIPFANFAQENTQNQFSENVETTFSIEVNADTSLEDLAEIEKMLKNDYNATIHFEDVKIVDNKIIALRMKLRSGNQSFMKSINNSNAPISAFKINLKEIGKNQYDVSIEDQGSMSALNFFGRKSENMFEKQPQMQTDFFKMNDEMNRLFKEMEASQQRFRELFEDLKNDPEAKKEIIENEDGSTTTIISKEQTK